MKKNLLHKTLSALAFVTLLWLFFAKSISAQSGGCGNIAFTLESVQSCCYRVHIDNPSECYTHLRLQLSTGSFVNWGASTQNGWTGTLLSPTEIMLTHISGIIPIGASVPLGFCLPVGVSPVLSILYDFECGLGKSCFTDFPLEGCPVPANASITGVKYQECGLNFYNNQPLLAGWTITLTNAEGDVIGEQQTASDGSYAFYDLPPGIYICRETAQGGWTPKVPASGQATIQLSPSQHAVQNFGNCPSSPCSCDSIYLHLTQVEGTSDTSTYYLSVTNQGPLCFSYINVKVDSGQLVSWNLLLPGWTATLQSPNLLRLNPPGPLLPAGGSIPLSLRIKGGTKHKVSLSTFWGNAPNVAECKRSYVFPNPPTPISTNCCPSGSQPGPELVVNGDFSSGNSGFTWGQPPYTYGQVNGPGKISVTNGSLIATHNGAFSCIGKTGSLSDQFLIVDGSLTPGVAWQEIVNVTAGTQYAFCAYTNNIIRPGSGLTPPTVQLQIVENFGINPQVVFTTTTTLPALPDMWVKITGLWTAPVSLSYKLRIITTSTVWQGNDFAVDCISFRSCSAAPVQCVCPSGTPGANLITNGDFSTSGGFTSNYVLNATVPPLQVGQYAIGSNPHVFNAGYEPCPGHAAGTGNMLVANGAANANTKVWCQNLTVTPNTTYLFSVWVTSVAGGSPAQLQLFVNSNSVGAGFQAPATCTWQQYCTTWFSGTNTNITICLADMNTTGGGNDFALDDISFRACSTTAPCQASFTATALDGCGHYQVVNTSTGNQPITYQWCDGLTSANLDVQLGCGPHTFCVTATCANGSTSTATQTITVVDHPPVITCPPNLSVSCSSPITPANTGFATATDDCSVPTVTYSDITLGIVPCNQTVLRTWKATKTLDNGCDNDTICKQSITFFDIVPPIIVCPPNLSVTALLPTCSAVVKDIKYVSATDNCTSPAVTYTASGLPAGQTDASGLTFPQGVTVVNYTAADKCGNTAKCSFLVTVTCDNSHCECTSSSSMAGPNLVVNGDFSAGNTGFSTNFAPFFAPGTATAIGRYSVLYSTQVPLANSQWSATDPSGLANGKFLVCDGAASAGQIAWQQTIPTTPGAQYTLCFQANNLVLSTLNYADVVLQVFINTIPIAGPVTLAETPAGWTLITATWPAGTATSAAIEIRATSTQSIGNDFALDDITFNKCSSQACSAAFDFTLSPCGKVQFTSQLTGAAPIVVSWNFGDLPSGTNNTSSAPNPMHQFSACGTYNVCLTITAANGCTSTVCHTVTVVDNVLPVITCRKDTTLFAKALPCSQVVGGLQYLSATDNCQLVSTNYTISGATTGNGSNNASGTTYNSGVSTVTYIATDWCGNTKTCSFKVTVFCDTMPCACPGGTSGANLVTNGHFTAGDVGFTSGLTNIGNTCGGGHYGVTINFTIFCGWPALVGVAGAPNQNFLQFDGTESGSTPTILWQNQVPVVPGKNYCFSFQWGTAFPATQQSFPVEIVALNSSNAATVLNSFNVQGAVSTWFLKSFTFIAPAGMQSIAIRQLTGGFVRDWGIDAICLREVHTCTADISSPEPNGCGKYTFHGFANGTPGYSYLWDFGDPTSGLINNMSTLKDPMHQFFTSGPHIVTLTITDATGCTAMYSITLNVPPFPSTTITGNPGLSICQGQSTTLTATGGPWTNCLWSNGVAGPSIIVTTSGMYCITCTNASGCTATACATVVVKPKPVIVITGNLNICAGSSTTLTASGGTAMWTPGGSNPLTVTPTGTTTYTVVVTGTNGCTASATATVIVKPKPVVVITGNLMVCAGSSTTLTATGGTPVWSPGGQTTPTITVTPTGTTTYTVVVTGTNGCTASATATVIVKPKPVVVITGNLMVCAGSSTTLTATGGTPVWSPGGQTTPTITVTPTGTTTYTVVVTGTNGCTASATATVTVKPKPVVVITGNLMVCAGSSTTLTATGGTPVWSPGGQTTPTITVMPTGTTTYTVVVTGTNGCTASATATVTVKPKPVVVITGNLMVCAGSSTTLTATGGTPVWSPGGQTTPTITVMPTGTTTYTVVVTGTNGCTASATATVIVKPKPVVVITGNLMVCAGSSTTLTATGGTPVWSPGGQTTPTITVMPTGTTTYTVVVTGINGCTASATATVIVKPKPIVVITGNLMVCAGSSTTLTATGGTPVWSPGGQTTPTITVTPTGTTTYTVVVTGTNGCTASATATVIVKPKPVVVITGNLMVCAGSSTTLTATGGTPVWSPGGQTTPTITVTPTVTTTYTVVVTGANGCTASATATVTVKPKPVVVITGNLMVCAGSGTTLTATGGTPVWSPGGQTTPTITVTPTVTTTYTVVVTGANSCTASATATVTVKPKPVAAITGNLVVCPGSSTILTASGIGTYKWQPGGQITPIITVSPIVNTIYTVVVTGTNGCTASASATVITFYDTVPCSCPGGGMAGANLVTNGHFSLGNVGFTSGLTFSNSCSNAGLYSVKQNFNAFCSGWNNLQDHTQDVQKTFLVLDGKDNGAVATDLWRNDVLLSANTDYCFSYFWASAYTNTDLNFQLQAYIPRPGQPDFIIGSQTISQTSTPWMPASFTFNSGALTGFQSIRLRQMTGDDHRDFGIDDICLKKVQSGCIAPPSNMVGWWPMDEQGGELTVIDKIGLHNGLPKPGSTVGNSSPTPVPGKVDGALQFFSPGFNSVEVADALDLNFGQGNFSIDAWITTTMGTETEPIVDKLGSSNNGYAFSIQGTSPFYPTLVLGKGTAVQVLAGPAITVGDWNFVAVAVNGQTATFYVGNSTSGFSTSTVAINGTYNASNPSRPLLIGSNPFNPHWDIAIDELEIFNRNVTATEFNAIWQADSLGKCKPVAVQNSIGRLPTHTSSLFMRIFPNPNLGTFTVKLPQPATSGLTFRVVDLTGRLVMEHPMETGSALQTVQADDLPAGIYFLQVIAEGRVMAVEKFVKQ